MQFLARCHLFDSNVCVCVSASAQQGRKLGTYLLFFSVHASHRCDSHSAGCERRLRKVNNKHRGYQSRSRMKHACIDTCLGQFIHHLPAMVFCRLRRVGGAGKLALNDPCAEDSVRPRGGWCLPAEGVESLLSVVEGEWRNSSVGFVRGANAMARRKAWQQLRPRSTLLSRATAVFSTFVFRVAHCMACAW